jgi:predicted RNase H-like HicB family nuclease
MKLKVLISEGEDGWFVVECPSIPGPHLSGEDRRRGSAIIKEAIEDGSDGRANPGREW